MKKVERTEIKGCKKNTATVRTKELCLILGLQKRRVFHLAEHGVLKKTGYGEFELIPSIQGYIRYLRAHCHRILPMFRKGL